MGQIRYMISDAAKMVDVEAHVLRYWEEELELPIARNEMSHRYYTEENIRLFQNIKELKERGFQLKAIKMLIPDLEKGDTEIASIVTRVEPGALAAPDVQEEKMERFQLILNRLIAEALHDNNEELGREISAQVSDNVIKEMDYLLRLQEEHEEERFKKLDELIRNSQKTRKEIASQKQQETKKKGFLWLKKVEKV